MTRWRLLMLVPMVLPLGFSMDIYLPALPQLEHHFHSTASQVHLTMSLFLIMFGCAQLIVGPLTDTLGRRPVALAGGAVFTLASLACAAAETIESLTLARILQACGAAATQVAAYAMAKDLTPSARQSAAFLGYLRSLGGIAPILAPKLGAILIAAFGWRSCFVTLTGLGIAVSLLVALTKCETLPPSKRIPFHLPSFVHAVNHILHTPRFVLLLIPAISCQAYLFCFFSVSPYLLIRELGYSEAEYSSFFGFNACVMMCTGLAAGRLIASLDPLRSITLGSAIALLGATAMIATQALLGLTAWGYLLTNMIIGAGTMFLLGPVLAEATRPFPMLIGIATSTAGFVEFLAGGLIGNLVVRLPLDTQLYHGLAAAMCATLSLITTEVLRLRDAAAAQPLMACPRLASEQKLENVAELDQTHQALVGVDHK